MSSPHQNQINRLSKELADLRKADAREAKKEADLMAKVNRANEAASRTKSASTMQSKLKELERASKDLASVPEKRADISGKVAAKSKDLRTYEDRDNFGAKGGVARRDCALVRQENGPDRDRLLVVQKAEGAAVTTTHLPPLLIDRKPSREKGVRIGIGQHIIYDASRQAATLDVRCVFHSANVSKSEFEVSLSGRANLRILARTYSGT